MLAGNNVGGNAANAPVCFLKALRNRVVDAAHRAFVDLSNFAIEPHSPYSVRVTCVMR